MRDNLLAAVTTAVSMARGAYTMPEALSYAAIVHDLDEFQAEDLEPLAKGQLKRLEAQTAPKR